MTLFESIAGRPLKFLNLDTSRPISRQLLRVWVLTLSNFRPYNFKISVTEWFLFWLNHSFLWISVNAVPGGPPPDLGEMGGRLRKDGELKVQSHETNAKTKVRYVFVFDQLILMCKPSKGDHYAFKEQLQVKQQCIWIKFICWIHRLGKFTHSHFILYKSYLLTYM